MHARSTWYNKIQFIRRFFERPCDGRTDWPILKEHILDCAREMQEAGLYAKTTYLGDIVFVIEKRIWKLYPKRIHP